jgi:hypothetical protein
LYLVVVSVVCVVGEAAESCEEVVVLCVWAADGFCEVVEVLDCVVLCAMTGRDKANTTSDPRMTASNVLSFI